MDFRRRPNSVNIKTRKFNTQLKVLKDNIFNFKSVVKFILPIAIVLALTPIALVYLVNITYQRRTISSENEIPLELRTGVVVIKQSDILYDFDNAKQIINIAKDLYTKKRVTQVLIVTYNPDKNITPSAEPYLQFFKDIPTDSYKIDVTSRTVEEACNTIENKLGVQKFVLSSYSNLLPRISYACSFQGLYVKPYLPKNLNLITPDDDFNNTLKIILNTIFPV